MEVSDRVEMTNVFVATRQLCYVYPSVTTSKAALSMVSARPDWPTLVFMGKYWVCFALLYFIDRPFNGVYLLYVLSLQVATYMLIISLFWLDFPAPRS